MPSRRMNKEEKQKSFGQEFELKSNHWFATPVWHAKILNVNFSAFKEHILDVKRNDPVGVKKSNYGGWQSQPNANDLGVLFGLMSPLKTSLDACKNVLLGEYPKEAAIQNYWYNVNDYGDYNTMHNHRGALLSGVFYIDVPDENMGALYFERDDHINYYIPENIGSYNHTVGTRIQYQPINGNLIIFPAWLKHGVEGNRSNQLRISMSFNYGFDE